MTALKPLEDRHVRSIASTSYPSNKTCAWPDCTNAVTLRQDGVTPTVHHIFPASQIGGRSYFVEIESVGIVPHAVGLCGSGTTGCHGDVEEHRKWIRLEDGVYNAYERHEEFSPTEDVSTTDWRFVGPLNPQPGSVEGKPKRKPRGQFRDGKSKTWTLRAPKGESMAAFHEVLEACQEKFQTELSVPELPLPYITLFACMKTYLES